MRAVVFSAAEDASADACDPSSALAPAVEQLTDEDIAVVFCSGKTRAQIERIQHALGLRQPFVCENGGAVFVPYGYFGFGVPDSRRMGLSDVVEFGPPYVEVVDKLRRTAARLGIDVVGFSDMSIAEVAADCGLSLMEARLAKLREYDEPFRIYASDAEETRRRLFKALRASGLGCSTGRQYEHVGAPVDARRGMALLRRLYQRAFGPILMIAAPDSNALPTWNSADRQADGWAQAIVQLVRDQRRSTWPQRSSS